MAVSNPSRSAGRRWLRRGLLGGAVWVLVAPSIAALLLVGSNRGQETEEVVEARVSLPTDRLKERQLDRARRLIADERWSDAATMLDDMLTGDRDFFIRPEQGDSTWRSIKTETATLIGSLPAAGRAAYDLQFRARADRLLNEAVAAGDGAAVVAVARRWFHTPAGRRATVLAALDALDAGQPLAAAAWLERLADEGGETFEPTLSVMRAVAWWRAGDRGKAIAVLGEARARGGTTVRVGGREVSLTFPDGGAAAWLASVAGTGGGAAERRDAEWWMCRGDAARNARVEASRPLLVPRYRVPLTRHPEEARLLEKQRRFFADRDIPLTPAGAPLAVDGRILVHSPLGLLAVDFETGKRIWLRGASSADSGPVGEADGVDVDVAAFGGLERVFGDASAGTASSNGRLVYAIEWDAGGRSQRAGPAPGATGNDQGSVLAAYDIAGRGALAWRHPAAPAEDAAATWHLGAPLVIGDQLFVLVEEKGEIRLDVLDAADGSLDWSQPLAELDEEQQTDRPETQIRRLSGLSPSFAEGVLVCPTGAGTAIAVDLATRTLLWAYHYDASGGAADPARAANRGPLGGLVRRGIQINAVPAVEQMATPGGWRDACPIIAAGRVLLTPVESDALHCLDLRTGSLKWTVPRGDSLYVAGVVDDRAIVVGGRSVDSLAIDTGASTWRKPVSLAPSAVSGRGILATNRLFLPLDTPEVVEINVAEGGISGRSPARDGVIPGNLVAYRGEVISQGIDSLDVFHQVAPVERGIETAAQERPSDPWVLLWQGQLDLDRGSIAAGLRAIAAARRADTQRVPAELVADALLFGMRRDFTVAAPLWREITQTAGPLPRSKALLCIAIDNQLASGAIGDAWRSFQSLLELPVADEGDDDWLISDVSDPSLSVAEPRWQQGRIGLLLAKAAPDVRADMDAFVANAIDAARRTADDADTIAALSRIATLFAAHPSAAAARQALQETIDARLAIRGSGRDGRRTLTLRRDLLALETQRAPEGGATSDKFVETFGEGAWPLGRVGVHPAARARPDDPMRLARVIPIPIDPRSRSAVPGLQVGFDIQSQALVLRDGVGRRVGEPIPFDPGRAGGVHPLFQPLQAEAAAIGPVLIVRSGGVVAAFEVRGSNAPPPDRLWMTSDSVGAPTEAPAFAVNLGRAAGRQKRNGNVPLGMRVSEPELPAIAQPARAMLPLPGGVVMLTGQTIELRDAVTGRVLWRRNRLPISGELFGDDEFLCVCPRDGARATILSTADGRAVRTCDLPSLDLRLATSGRRLVALGPVATPAGMPVEWIDAATGTRVKLGDFSAAARAAPAGPGMLAILEPDGTLTVIDVEGGGVRFRVNLPAMPAGLEHLQVIPWHDRLLVVVGRQETAAEQRQLEKFDAVAPLPQMTPGEEAMGGVFTGSIWAVARSDGASLWPVPATVVRHCLHRHQPADLPVLLFARHLHARGEGTKSRLGVLMLDKRTGHAVFADDRLAIQPQAFFGCEISGDPDRHILVLGRSGGDASEIRLDFTGEPMAPRPPHQASVKPAGGVLSTIESWLQRAITLPLPF